MKIPKTPDAAVKKPAGLAAAAAAARVVAAILIAMALAPSADAQWRRESDHDSSLIFRGGMYFPNADSDLWNYNERYLTLESSDFDAAIGGVVFRLPADNYLNISFGMDVYQKKHPTRYRDYVDEGGFPILQDLELTLVPLTVSAELLPFGRHAEHGRSGHDGNPRVRPYLGAGLGLYAYEYTEVGDQIDFRDDTIHTAELISEGTEPGFFVSGGIDVPIGHRAVFALDARYHWVKAPLSDDFVGFDDFDLGGAQVTVGLGYCF